MQEESDVPSVDEVTQFCSRLQSMKPTLQVTTADAPLNISLWIFQLFRHIFLNISWYFFQFHVFKTLYLKHMFLDDDWWYDGMVQWQLIVV